jgi:hypothetical protein
MAETTADVRRDIELTRERMSDTIAQLEQKLNVMQVVRDNPWPAIALAVGAGVLLAGSKADVKAAVATAKATGGASSKVGNVLDDVVARLIGGVSAAINERVDGWVDELKESIGAPTGHHRRERVLQASAIAPEMTERGSVLREAETAYVESDRGITRERERAGRAVSF